MLKNLLTHPSPTLVDCVNQVSQFLLQKQPKCFWRGFRLQQLEVME